MKTLLTTLLVLALCACASDRPMAGKNTHDKHMTHSAVLSKAESFKLAKILASQPDAHKERYGARHPQETLEFFGIKPGMTVVEGLPGGGWYSKILLPYLGREGRLIGADYSLDMYPMFGFFSAEQLEAKKTWVNDWSKEANGWGGAYSAPVDAFAFGSMPTSVNGTADAVLFIRALHNLRRFENDGQFLTHALNDSVRALKSGGIVGVVQHQAPDSAPVDSVMGTRGYLNKQDVIAMMEKAGLKYVGESKINHNSKDTPADDEVVWRLPPTLVTSREDPALRSKMQAIGESNRMTLKFVKP